MVEQLYLLLQLVEDELYDDVVLHLEELVHPLRDPRLQHVQLYLGHVNLETIIQRKQFVNKK